MDESGLTTVQSTQQVIAMKGKKQVVLLQVQKEEFTAPSFVACHLLERLSLPQ